MAVTIKPGYPPTTADEIAKLERRRGISLAEECRAFLLRINRTRPNST